MKGIVSLQKRRRRKKNGWVNKEFYKVFDIKERGEGEGEEGGEVGEQEEQEEEKGLTLDMYCIVSNYNNSNSK